jgi:hypothetical protein
VPPLSPAPDTLGLGSPSLGPWFAPSGGTLPSLALPQADMSISVSLAASVEWRAPVVGTVSYYVATASRPIQLARLRAENGNPAFTNGRLVVLFTLMPEVELRLHQLVTSIPSPDGTALASNTVPTRPRVRWLAFEVSVANVTALGQLLPLGFPAAFTTDQQRAAYLGLTFASGTFANAREPVTILKRPAGDNIILTNGTGLPLNGLLWAFDHRGRPVDAGAVAAWWEYLATVPFDNLWASSTTADQRTAERAAGHVVHIVSAHEGPLSAGHLARLTPTNLTQIGASQALYARSGTAAATLALTTAPDPDTAPIPRLALLPHGRYDDPAASGTSALSGLTSASWPAALARDFVRLGFLDVEAHLVGKDRTDPRQADDDRRVQALQNGTGPVFHTRIDAGTRQMLSLLRSGATASVMAPVMDLNWGAVDPPDLGTGDLPDRVNFITHALLGEGAASGGTVSNQKIAFEFPDPANPIPLPQGAWVRVWTHGIEQDTGTHVRFDGGAGRIDATGKAFVVVGLPDGAASPEAQMSMDVLVVTGSRVRLFTDRRFNRPALVAGAKVALPATGLPAGFGVRQLETGTDFIRATNAYLSGATLLAIPTAAGAPFALVDLDTLSNPTDYSVDTLRTSLGPGDRVIITQPAFGATPEGTLTAGPAPNGASTTYRTRNGLVAAAAGMGQPAPTMERREVLALDPASASGVIAGAPGLASMHEAPPSQLGHAGVPAAAETHGVALDIRGPAAVPLANLMIERASANLQSFITAAQVPPLAAPTAPTGAILWTSVLETLSRGIAGDAAVRTIAANGFMPGQSWLDLKADIENAIPMLDVDTLIDSATFDDDVLAKAIDRLVLKTRDGVFDAAPSLSAAIARAEDYIFIETPALDSLSAQAGAIDLIAKITTRLNERGSLYVLIACPEKFLPKQAKQLDAVRVSAISAALDTLRTVAPDRVVLFAPTAGSGRQAYMATTTVIIDDVYALTGSTHLWRRGLTFDSSIAAASFDEALTDGRCAAIAGLRQQLMADRLGVSANLAPQDPADLVFILNKIIAAGGQGRIAAGAYPGRPDTTPAGTRDAWNPDGAASGTSDWLLFFNGLQASVRDEISNAVR